MSFSDLSADVKALACSLVAKGFKHGDRAAIWAPNCAEWIIAALAIQYVGGTLVTVNTRYKASEARDIISDSGSSVAFVVDEFWASTTPSHWLRSLLMDLSIVTIKAPGSSDHDGISEWIADGAAADDELCRRAPRNGNQSARTTCRIFYSLRHNRPSQRCVTTHGQNLKAFTTFADILDSMPTIAI